MREGWSKRKLSEVLKLKSGDGLTAKKMIDGPYPVYGGNGVAGYHNDFNHDSPQVIIGRVGALCGNARFIEESFWLTDNAFKVSEGIEHFDEQFLVYLLNHLNLRQYARQAAQPVVSNSSLKDVSLVYPHSLEEQKQIVVILDKAFAAINQAKANIEKNIANAKELFQSKLNEIFSQKRDGWEEKQIKNLTLLVTKGSSPKWQGVNYVEDGGIFFLTSKNVGEGELLLSNKKYLEEKFNEIQKTSILKKGDVLTNIVGASIGRTAIFDLEEVTNINQAVCLMRCNAEKVYSYYLMYLLNSPFFKKILHDNEVDNARANLSLTFFKNLYIPLPKIIEQKEIVEKIKLLSSEINKIESNYNKKLKDLEELKKSILQKAFAGELTVSHHDLKDLKMA